jgi:hypothetical protein
MGIQLVAIDFTVDTGRLWLGWVFLSMRIIQPKLLNSRTISRFLVKFLKPKTHHNNHRRKQEAPPPAPLADENGRFVCLMEGASSI